VLSITKPAKKPSPVSPAISGATINPFSHPPPRHKRQLLLCESTYGDREHETGDPAEQLAAIVNRVAKRGGSIIIPAFAIAARNVYVLPAPLETSSAFRVSPFT